MVGQIALVGGDEFRSGCEEMDRTVLRATGVERPRVLIVPTAAADQNPSKAASNGVDYFAGLGARASALMVLGPAEASDEGFLSPVDDAHVVYFTGGDPSHLLGTLRGSRLLDKLAGARQRGAIVAGSSAGAMVLGSWMRFRGWKEALAIVEGAAVLPHHDGSDPNRVLEELLETAPGGVSILGIDGRTCCVGGSGGWKVVGAGAVTLYARGRWLRFSSGESVPLHA